MPIADEEVTQLAESIHQARNDLSAIASMLTLQAKLTSDAEVSASLLAARQRVRAIARVNAALDGTARSSPTVDMTNVLSSLVGDLQDSVEGRPVTILAAMEQSVFLPVSYARPIGLITNEWVTNALKYAFVGERSGTVTISLSCQDCLCHLTVGDDGVGIDPMLAPQGTGLGMRLVQGLARQLGGEVRSDVPDKGGTTWTLSFTG